MRGVQLNLLTPLEWWHNSPYLFYTMADYFIEEASGLALKFVRAEPEYTDGMGAMDVDKLIEDFADYIDRNY